MATVRDVVAALDAIAPFAMAEEWDNVGLLAGRPDATATKALLTIDLQPAVAQEAIASKCDVVVSYHPPIFRPLKRLVGGVPGDEAILSLLERRIAVVSPHTALDAARGGINDWIAAGIGSGDVRALLPHSDLPATEETKLVTYCPAESVDRLRDALASVGAGRIGAYSRCSFETRGMGTFFGEAGAAPTIGKAGRLERFDEVRLEMVCPRSALALAIESVRHFHPYEEAPIEIYKLEERPQRSRGAGRRLTLDAPLGIAEIAARLRSLFSVASVRCALPASAPPTHATIGISAGSGASLIDAAIDQGCTLFVTGELKHHEALAALARGCGLVVAGHTNTERGYLPRLAESLASKLSGVSFAVSTKDCDPFTAA
ncbi:MAG: Nif3-like dinuclear metal center hexameric protein [Phycisphaerales bacterium]